jgi:hypothetical protein
MRAGARESNQIVPGATTYIEHIAAAPAIEIDEPR